MPRRFSVANSLIIKAILSPFVDPLPVSVGGGDIDPSASVRVRVAASAVCLGPPRTS